MKRGSSKSAQMINFICCLLFLFFSFTYLYFFQGEMMKMVQHLLSNGRTAYHALLFSSLISLALAVLGLACSHFISFLPTRFKALGWLPSYMLLGLLTDVSLSITEPSSHAVGFIPFFLVSIAYLVALAILSRIQEPRFEKSSFSELLWPNLLQTVLCIAFTCGVGNTNRTLHYELRIERLAIEENYEKVLQVGAEEPNVSRCIMYLRVYALSQNGELGDRLFMYPNNLGTESLLPSPIDSLRPANMPSKLREYLGGFPIHDMNATRFLQHLASKPDAKEPVRDYLLCSFLLDKNLPAFVDSLLSFYGPKDTVEVQEKELKLNKKKKKKEKEPIVFTQLPRYYSEALLLYSRLNDKPVAVLKDDETLQNYLDFSKYNRQTSNKAERERLCRLYYNDTYWCYYFFDNTK